MPDISTYSFLDLTGNIVHPSVGAYTFTGQGIGEMTIAMATDRTAHDVAADGAVMVSKLAGENGIITIQAQQTSSLHNWLMNWYNYLYLADTDEWTQTTILIRAPKMGRSHVGIGVSPQKVGDTPYQAQGQRVTWPLMCADLKTLPI
ncbi:phage protein [Sporomusa sp. KB1]|uniref:phage protein n=1 Tax=Sporomusa sp. KB1 TaxID=943346 RepID=UPI0011A95EFF|nr:phage protein [Sporomusa sp. KB1]TWH46332.1 uncharacterized protein DUF3277 [Sporomusa sp. KB1]